MKVAVIGSRNLQVPNLAEYLPPETTEIVSGGAKGVDSSAREYATANGIKIVEFLPNYKQFGRGAPLKRNLQIIEYSDTVLAFWDGASRGTKYVIDNCKKLGVNLQIVSVAC
ncbi:MAG: DUF2493 domain-containing protein [Defluviitaleaceae bacterium]|nr:DUF2493 domain-containing protein [Defluviitaleaceae bacterium]